MAEDVNVTNLPDSGSSSRVAYDFMRYLNRSGVKPSLSDVKPNGRYWQAKAIIRLTDESGGA